VLFVRGFFFQIILGESLAMEVESRRTEKSDCENKHYGQDHGIVESS
jgi:hypothetical protein